MAALQQRSCQQLLGKLGVFLVEPFFDGRVDVVDDLAQVFQILGGHLQLGRFIQVVLPFILRDSRRGERR